jgi:hypothetical protein
LEREGTRVRQATAVARVVLAAVVLVAVMTHVGAVEAQGVESGGREIKRMQLPRVGGISIPSQAFGEDVFSEAADDFLWNSAGCVIQLEWWGRYQGTPVPPIGFVVTFYSDVPGPPFSRPGTQLYTTIVTDYHEQYDDEYDQYHYYHVFWDDPFYPTPGAIHWVSIQAGLPDVCTWGWCECDPAYYWNDEAVWDSPFSGVARWTPMSEVYGRHIELAFIIHDDLLVPVEETSWGGVKALFR